MKPKTTDHAEMAEIARRKGRAEGGAGETSGDRWLGEPQRIYKEAPIGLCAFDTNLRYVHVNDWLAALNGIPAEDHLGRTIGEVLPHVAAGIESQLCHVIETGEPIVGGTVDAETPAHPGLTRTFEHNYFPIKSGDDTVVGVSCVVQEVTERKRAEDEIKRLNEGLEQRVRERTRELRRELRERKRAEKALRESEERYRELFDESPVAIWVEDWSPIKQMLDDLARGGVKDWRGYFNSRRDQLSTAYDLAKILDISHATIKLYRKESKEHLLRMSAGAVVIDEELDAFREMVLSFLAGQTTVNIESKDTAGDGSEIIVRRRIVIPPKHRGDWSRVIYAIEDITERKRAEEAFKESEAKLREILENSPIGVAVVSHALDDAGVTGNRLFINSAFVQMFGGASREDLIEAEISGSWVDPDQHTRPRRS